jgi:hypothetical protein
VFLCLSFLCESRRKKAEGWRGGEGFPPHAQAKRERRDTPQRQDPEAEAKQVKTKSI